MRATPTLKPIRRHHAFILAFILCSMISCGTELKGNGEPATEQRTVSAFDRLDVDDGAEVTLTIDPSATGDVQLTVITDSNLIEFLTTRVTDGELRVAPDRDGGTSTDLGFDVSAAVATVNSVTVNNGAHATITGSVGEAKLEADNGASINGTALEASSASIEVDNGAQISICSTGPVTASAANGAELTVLCGGDATAVEASDGGRVVTTP